MSRLAEHSVSAAKPLAVAPLAFRTRRELERMILSGALAPGAKLNEVALAKTLGVSRGPIREACRSLERAGLVTIIMNRGAFVRVVSLDEAKESYVVCGVLFATGAELTADVANAKQKADLKKLVDGMDRAVKANDHDKYFELNIKFHEKIVAYSGNRQVSAIYLEQSKKIGLLRRKAFDKSGNMALSNAEHRKVLDAILKSDSAAARRHADHHGRGGRSRFHKSLDDLDM